MLLIEVALSLKKILKKKEVRNQSSPHHSKKKKKKKAYKRHKSLHLFATKTTTPLLHHYS